MQIDGQPRVTVIVCVRNGQATLRAQLDALSSQQGAPPYEVIVVDNGSTDGTSAVYQEWLADGTGSAGRARMLPATTRASLPYARNVGAAHAAGPLLAFCDADDVVHSGWVAAAHRAFLDGSHALGGRILRLLPSGRPSDEVVLNSLDGVAGRFKTYPMFWGCNFAVSTAVFEACGGFDESLPPYGCDDLEISIRLGEHGHSIAYVRDMVVYYTLPTGIRRRLQRKYRTGIAQACVWSRHPGFYGPIPTAFSLVRRMPSGPIRALRGKSNGRIPTRVLRGLERIAELAGQAHGVRHWVGSGRLGAPEYLQSGARR